MKILATIHDAPKKYTIRMVFKVGKVGEEVVTEENFRFLDADAFFLLLKYFIYFSKEKTVFF